MAGRSPHRHPMPAAGEAVGPSPPLLNPLGAGGFKPASTIPGRIMVGPPIKYEEVMAERSKKKVEKPPPGLEGTASGLLKARPRKGRGSNGGKDEAKPMQSLRSGIISPSRGGVLSPPGKYASRDTSAGKQSKKLTWSLEGAEPAAAPQVYDKGPAEDETPQTTPSVSRAGSISRGGSEADADKAGRPPRTASTGKRSGGSGGGKSSRESRGSKRHGGRLEGDLLPDDRPGSGLERGGSGRGRNRSRGRDTGNRPGSLDSTGSGRSTSRGSDGMALSWSRRGSRSLTPSALMGIGSSGAHHTGGDAEVWGELSNRGNSRASASSRARRSEQGSRLSFVELERQWGIRIGEPVPPRAQVDTPNAARIRLEVEKRARIREMHAPHAPKPGPDYFQASMSVDEAAKLSRETLLAMMSARSLSPPRERGAAAGPMGGPAEEEEGALPQVAGKEPVSEARGGPGTMVMGGGAQGSYTPEKVASKTRGRALEMLEKDQAGPSLVLKQPTSGAAHLKAAKTAAAARRPVYTVDSAGGMWELNGVPAPAVIPSEYSLTELAPYPIFEHHIGIKPWQKAQTHERRDARVAIPKHVLQAQAESELKALTPDEVKLLMETYFPSLEERLKRSKAEQHPVVELTAEEEAAMHAEQQHQPLSVLTAAGIVHWAPNSIAHKRLVEARRDPDVQARLHHLVTKVLPSMRKASRRNAAVDHVEENQKRAAKAEKKEPKRRKETVYEAEERKRQVKKFKEGRDRELEEQWSRKQGERAVRLKYHTVQQIWKEEQQHLQRVWLSGLMCAQTVLRFLAPIRLRQSSTVHARRFIVSMLLIQRWLRKIIWSKRRVVADRLSRVAWRRLLHIRIMRKRSYCAIIAQFCRDYKKRSRAIAAMESFRHKVLLIQRAIRRFLKYRRFRWLMLELQWAAFEKRRNRKLKREWTKAWNGMMAEISKVFKMPPARLRRDLNSKSIRWVTEMMDAMIAKLPFEIKNIVVVKASTREQVLKAEKKKILREHKEKLIFYHRRVEQVKENKAIKDMVSATFPALTEMSVVSSPELQFLMDSDKPPVEPELTPLLPEPRLEELLLQAQKMEREEHEKLETMAEESSRTGTPSAGGDRPLTRAGSFYRHALRKLSEFDAAGEAGLKGEELGGEEETGAEGAGGRG